MLVARSSFIFVQQNSRITSCKTTAAIELSPEDRVLKHKHFKTYKDSFSFNKQK